MKVRSDSFVAGQPLPDALAFARPDPTSRVTLSDNRNPHLAWEDVPEGTCSFAVLCIDHDAPSRPDDVNHPDREVPADLPRVESRAERLLPAPGARAPPPRRGGGWARACIPARSHPVASRVRNCLMAPAKG